MSTGKGLDVGPVAQLLLDTVVEHFATAGEPLPKRRLIVPGNVRLIAWDNCKDGQLHIALTGIGTGPAPDSGSNTGKAVGNPISAAGLRHVVLAAQIVMKTSDGDGDTPPSPEVLTVEGLRHMRYAGLLSQAIIEAVSRIKNDPRIQGRVLAGAVDSLGPEGGYCAVEGSLAITVPALA